MKHFVLPAAALLALGGCAQPAANSTNASTATNATAFNESAADVTEVPDESADANAAEAEDAGDNELENMSGPIEPDLPIDPPPAKAPAAKEKQP